MSAYAGKEEEARCAEVGVDVFLPKPITTSSLLQAVLEARKLTAPAAAPAASAPRRAEFAGFRVLMAEDNDANQFVARELLGRLGLELDIAADGQTAVELGCRGGYDAIFMDMQMPVMDGLAATRALRADPSLPRVPIIALTANAMRSDVEACLAAGMDDFLSKPIDRQALAATLRRWLRPEGSAAPSAEPHRPEAPAPPPASGIDVEGSLRRLGLPPDRFRALLARFGAGLGPGLADLRAAVADGDAEAARRHAHALAGAAGNLGADRLRALAKDLELAARDGRADLPVRLGSVEREAVAVAEAIAGLTGPAPDAPDPGAAGKATADPVALARQLDRLRAALAGLDLTGAAEALEALEALPAPDEVRPDLARIRRLVDDYRFEEAQALAERLATE